LSQLEEERETKNGQRRAEERQNTRIIMTK
jgi:hypothetical protein